MMPAILTFLVGGATIAFGIWLYYRFLGRKA